MGRAVHVARERGDFAAENVELSNLCVVLRSLGRADEAVAARRECLALLPADVDPRHRIVASLNLGQLLLAVDRAAEGKAAIDEVAASISVLCGQHDGPVRLEGLSMEADGRLTSLTVGSGC
ncbi:hypothetical protein [Kitasatospora sp. NPDC006786]|uniref:hypothetical protein n=1 Tax=unclassified Kitasatospora TaxID=2633591 RepID=UPI003409122C